MIKIHVERDIRRKEKEGGEEREGNSRDGEEK